MDQKKILVVEDDLNLGFLLVDFLQTENFYVKLCRDGIGGLRAMEKAQYDLCILDVMMPKLDGFSLARTARKKGCATPFIFLTAKSMKQDRLKGYAIGAEDYITKPFDEEELLCKIRVILRRQQEPTTDESEFTIGHYTFDSNRLELSICDKKHRLTVKENEILKLLCQHKNNVLKRDEAVQKLYGREDYFLGRSFDVYISRLRKLLKEDPAVEIENVFKVGFMLKDGSDN